MVDRINHQAQRSLGASLQFRGAQAIPGHSLIPRFEHSAITQVDDQVARRRIDGDPAQPAEACFFRFQQFNSDRIPFRCNCKSERIRERRSSSMQFVDA